jgi:ribosomal protein S18
MSDFSKDKVYLCYIFYNNDIIQIYDERVDEYISKIYLTKVSHKHKIIEELYKVIDLPSTKSYFNILELHSVHFNKKRLDNTKILKYVLPNIIEINDYKIITYLENYWNQMSKIKIKEITSNSISNITNNKINNYTKDHGIIFIITNQTSNFIMSYKYPNDLSIILLDEYENDRLIMNNINRRTKKFNFIRKYQNDKIIPYIDEDNLEGYEEFDKVFINDTYEENIEININSPYDDELEKKYKFLNKK